MSVKTVTGNVKWFKKTFGFLCTPACPQDVFVHFDDIEELGFRELRQGEFVTFELVFTDKGPKAKKVRRLPSPRVR